MRGVEGEGKVIFPLAAEWLLQIPDVDYSLHPALCHLPLVQGRCEMCNPVYPARWSGSLPYRKCLVSLQPAQKALL